MRRTHLRRHGNILKRLLVHVAGFNLGILMRTLIGRATPKQYAELLSGASSLLSRLGELLCGIPARLRIITAAHLGSAGRLCLTGQATRPTAA